MANMMVVSSGLDCSAALELVRGCFESEWSRREMEMGFLRVDGILIACRNAWRVGMTSIQRSIREGGKVHERTVRRYMARACHRSKEASERAGKCMKDSSSFSHNVFVYSQGRAQSEKGNSKAMKCQVSPQRAVIVRRLENVRNWR